MKKFTGPITATELQYKHRVISRAWRRRGNRALRPAADRLFDLMARYSIEGKR